MNESREGSSGAAPEITPLCCSVNFRLHAATGAVFGPLEKGLLARGPYPRLVATKHLEAPNFVWPTARGQAPAFVAGAKARLDFSGPCSNPNGGQTAGSTLPPTKFACASSTRTLLPRVRVTKCRLLLPLSKEGPGHRKSPSGHGLVSEARCSQDPVEGWGVGNAETGRENGE